MWLQQGQIKVYTHNQHSCQVSTSCTLWFLRYSLDEVIKVEVTMFTCQIKVTPWTCTATPSNKSSHQVRIPIPNGLWDPAQARVFPQPTQPPACPANVMGENNSCIVFIGCVVKITDILQQRYETFNLYFIYGTSIFLFSSLSHIPKILSLFPKFIV